MSEELQEDGFAGAGIMNFIRRLIGAVEPVPSVGVDSALIS